jgi:6-phosphogluconolactonase (cycloisomerase 2 family)
MAANYSEGTLTVLPIRPDGGLGEATDVFQSTGPKSPERADDNPPGNFAVSDHAHGHVHMVGMDPSGNYIIANDAGLDKVLVFKLNLATGKLIASAPLMEKPGAAPRHFAFDPKGKIFYNLLEQDSKLAAYDFDPANASFKLRQKLSTLPDGYQGSNLASELLITRNGKYLYAANRLRDTIATFAVGKDGMLQKIGETPCQSDYPRSLTLDPSDKFLFSLNQRGDSVTVFKIDPKNGMPRFTGQFLAVGAPGSMAFLEDPAKH